jgi:uncharacterized coiled-coil DUF342 family protein
MIDKLADERDSLRTAQRRVLDELNQTRTKVRTIRDELQKLRKQRDDLNDNVRELKKTRSLLQTESRQELTILHQLLRKMADRPHASLAEKELADLEWKFQTESLDKDDERKIMLKIRSLETKVTVYHKVGKLREGITKKRDEAENVHVRIQELASESQKHHEEIMELSKVFDKLRLRQVEQLGRLQQLRMKMGEVNEQYVDVKHTLTETEKRVQREKEEAYKEGLKSSAKKKAGQGEKLSLHELAALLGGEDERE